MFSAWGEITDDSNPGIAFPFAFTGREYDPETGLYFYRARYYDPSTGRFISEDPIGFSAGDTNLSRYVFNSPTNYVDPFGLKEAPGFWRLYVHYFTWDTFQTALDFLGLIPGVGEVADITNMLIYMFRGKWDDAALSAMGAIPFAGWVSTGTRLAKKGFKALDFVSTGAKMADEAADLRKGGKLVDPGLADDARRVRGGADKAPPRPADPPRSKCKNGDDGPLCFVAGTQVAVPVHSAPWWAGSGEQDAADEQDCVGEGHANAARTLASIVLVGAAGTLVEQQRRRNRRRKDKDWPCVIGNSRALESFAPTDTEPDETPGAKLRATRAMLKAAKQESDAPRRQPANTVSCARAGMAGAALRQPGDGRPSLRTRHTQKRRSAGIWAGLCLLAALLVWAPLPAWLFGGGAAERYAERVGAGVSTAPAQASPQAVAAARPLAGAAWTTRNIEDLRPGDAVLAWDAKAGCVRPQRIEAVFVRTGRRLRVLEIADAQGNTQVLCTTDEHPFWSADQAAYVAAGELHVGDRLLALDGTALRVRSSRIEEHPHGIPLYNFCVAQDHTYFAAGGDGTDLVLVHNANAAGSCQEGNYERADGPDNTPAPNEPTGPGPQEAARGATGPRVIDPATLPKPPGMSNAQLGDLLQWPRGPGTHASQMAQAERLIQGLTPEGVAAIRQGGVTRDMVLRWAEFYEAEAIRVPQNVNAAARAAYLRALAEEL